MDYLVMPFYLSVPLPGPFRYSTRVGGRRRGPGLVGGLFALVAGIVKLMVKSVVWMVVATFYVTVMFYVLLFKGGVAGVRAYRQHLDRRAAAQQPDPLTVPFPVRRSAA